MPSVAAAQRKNFAERNAVAVLVVVIAAAARECLC